MLCPQEGLAFRKGISEGRQLESNRRLLEQCTLIMTHMLHFDALPSMPSIQLRWLIGNFGMHEYSSQYQTPESAFKASIALGPFVPLKPQSCGGL